MKLKIFRNSLDTIKISIYFFLIIFGPKFSSLIDLSLVVNSVVLVYYLYFFVYKNWYN